MDLRHVICRGDVKGISSIWRTITTLDKEKINSLEHRLDLKVNRECSSEDAPCQKFGSERPLGYTEAQVTDESNCAQN